MTEAGHILLVDDEPAFQRLGAAFLRNAGHRVTIAGDAESAILAARDTAPDVVLLDLAMPPHLTPEAGLDLIGRFAPALVVVLTGHADHALALRATELGAWDFLAKPADPDMLGFVVSRAVRKAQLNAELRERRARDDADDLGMIGRSAAMQRLRDMVRRLGPANISVVILGPTGSGKELVARALHASSVRRAGPFVPVHCGALPAELLESELFGHLNEGTFVPVGARVQKRADVRVVSATHRDLETMVAEQTFREDLFYRLRGIVLRKPSLSERMDDIPLLAARFLRRSAPRATLTQDALSCLSSRIWPGNVRELRSLIELAVALAAPDASSIDAELPRFAAGEGVGAGETQAPSNGKLDDAVAALESRLLRETLEATKGNQSEAARRLGLSRVGLAKKLSRLGLRA